MRAWRVHELGDPMDVMRLEEVDPPVARAGEVVIDVATAALNFPDILVCRGEYQEKPALPFTPGIEVAGTVRSVGEGVEGLAPGQRVVAGPAPTYGALSE